MSRQPRLRNSRATHIYSSNSQFVLCPPFLSECEATAFEKESIWQYMIWTKGSEPLPTALDARIPDKIAGEDSLYNITYYEVSRLPSISPRPYESLIGLTERQITCISQSSPLERQFLSQTCVITCLCRL